VRHASAAAAAARSERAGGTGAGARCGLTPSALASIACRDSLQKNALEKLDRRAAELAGAGPARCEAAYMRHMGDLMDELLADYVEPA